MSHLEYGIFLGSVPLVHLWLMDIESERPCNHVLTKLGLLQWVWMNTEFFTLELGF